MILLERPTPILYSQGTPTILSSVLLYCSCHYGIACCKIYHSSSSSLCSAYLMCLLCTAPFLFPPPFLLSGLVSVLYSRLTISRAKKKKKGETVHPLIPLSSTLASDEMTEVLPSGYPSPQDAVFSSVHAGYCVCMMRVHVFKTPQAVFLSVFLFLMTPLDVSITHSYSMCAYCLMILCMSSRTQLMEEGGGAVDFLQAPHSGKKTQTEGSLRKYCSTTSSTVFLLSSRYYSTQRT